MDSVNTEGFAKEILEYNSNSMILIFDFNKIKFYHIPPNIKIKNDTVFFWRAKNQVIQECFGVVFFVLNILLLTKIFLIICIKYSPKICWIENLYASIIVGILKKFHFCGKSFYFAYDWVAGSNSEKFLSNIINNWIFPYLDYFACRLNDVVLHHTKEISEIRYKFWGKKITKKEKMYTNIFRLMKEKTYSTLEKNVICFLGNVKSDSGLHIVIESFHEIRRRHNFILEIIGPNVPQNLYLKNLAYEHKVNKYVRFYDFIEESKLVDNFSKCFCGINLLTDKESYSRYTIPGKFIQYLFYLIPIITTKHAGSFANIIKDHGLGFVIEPLREDFIDAVEKVYKDQKQFRENIINYVKNYHKNNIEEILSN